MMPGCLSYDIFVKDCEEKVKAGHEEKILRQTTEIKINQNQSFTVTEVIPRENNFKDNPCQIRRLKQMCLFWVWCFQE
jgi:hypothetical protein